MTRGDTELVRHPVQPLTRHQIGLIHRQQRERDVHLLGPQLTERVGERISTNSASHPGYRPSKARTLPVTTSVGVARKPILITPVTSRAAALARPTAFARPS